MCAAVEVNFSQPVYSVEENSGVVEIQLIFSNPSSIDITVEVNSEEINATGEYIYTYIRIENGSQSLTQISMTH